MNVRAKLIQLRDEIAGEVELLEVTPERIEAATAQIELIRAMYPRDERLEAFQSHMIAHPEWIGVYAAMTIDLIDARVSPKQ